MVPNAIAGRIELPRDVEVAKLLVALETSECVAVVGPSGVGKSVVCRALLEARAGDGRRTLWFGAEAFETSDFTMLEAALGSAIRYQSFCRSRRDAIGSSSSTASTVSTRPMQFATPYDCSFLHAGPRPQRAGASSSPVRRRNGHECKKRSNAKA